MLSGLSGLLIAVFWPPLMGWLSRGLAAAACLYLWIACRALPEFRMDREREPTGRRDPRVPDHSTPLRYPAWVGQVSGYLVMGVLSSIFPLILRDTLGFAESRVGLLLLVRAGAAAKTLLAWRAPARGSA